MELKELDLTTLTADELDSYTKQAADSLDWSAKELSAISELWDERNPFLSDRAEQWLKQQRDDRERYTQTYKAIAGRLADENDRRNAKAQLQAHIAHTLMAARGVLLERGYLLAASEVSKALDDEGIDYEAEGAEPYERAKCTCDGKTICARCQDVDDQEWNDQVARDREAHKKLDPQHADEL
jgi:hypothetical protein